jgi:hypothetical protein
MDEMASQQTINRLTDYLRRHFEVEIPPHGAALGRTIKVLAMQAVELNLREIVDLVLREEALAKGFSLHLLNYHTRTEQLVAQAMLAYTPRDTTSICTTLAEAEDAFNNRPQDATNVTCQDPTRRVRQDQT